MDFKKRKIEENGGLVAEAAGNGSAIAMARIPAGVPAVIPVAGGVPGTIPVAGAAGPGPGTVPVPVTVPAPRYAVPAYLTRDDARILVDSMTTEDIRELFLDAVLLHPDVLEGVRKFADKDPAHRKIFVRGLGGETTTESLKAVFSQHGELEEGIVIIDKVTGKSRGYGFVTFKHRDCALNALKESSKRIDSRICVCHLASLGPTSAQPSQDTSSRKIYVGNVPMDWSPDILLNLFALYGEIEEGPLGFDKQSGRSKGFALFIYKTEEATKRALEEPVKIYEGHQLFCKLALRDEGLKQRPGGMQGQHGALELPVAQMGGVAPAPANMPYSASPLQGMMSVGAPYNQTVVPQLNAGLLNPTMSTSMHANLAMPNPSLPGADLLARSAALPSPFNPSYPQVMNPGMSQIQTASGLPSYGSQIVVSPYSSSQVGTYGELTAPYSAPSTMYSAVPGAMTSQSHVMHGQGQYDKSYQNQIQQSASRAHIGAPSMPYYGM